LSFANTVRKEVIEIFFSQLTQLLQPFKGDHGKKPVIFYQGTIDEDFRQDLEKKSNDLVGQDIPFSFRFASYEELEKEAIYLQPDLPKNKPLRLLTLTGVGSVADGGTRIRSVGVIK
jgi:Ser-tRNA(Ala) deacylase AlaX